MMKQKGFAHPMVSVAIILLILATVGGFYFWNNKSDNKLPVPNQIFTSPTPTLSPWKTYVNNQLGMKITYPGEGVILTDKSYAEGECGKAIKETGSEISLDNFFKIKIVPWTGTLDEYLVSQRAKNAYDLEKIEGSGADEAINLVGLKKNFEVAVGYPPLVYVKYLFKKGDNLYLVSRFQNPINKGGCINPEVLDPSKYAQYLDLGWNQKNSFKFN